MQLLASPIETGDERVPGLVVGDHPLLLVGDQLALLQAGDDALEGVVEVGLDDAVAPRAAGRDGGLVADVREVGAGQPGVWRATSARRTPSAERLAPGVHLHDLLAALQVGRRHADVAVEPAGAQERGVELAELVRGADDHELVALVEPVHLDQQLVERLVLLRLPPPGRRCRGGGRRRRARR